MKKLVLIDGNSILNRAFYGIMGNKMLMTEDGTYTNAVYGFLSILFKIQEDINPENLVVSFDLKAPTHRHKMYDQYKANRKGMPNELAQQLPIIKQVLQAMNICIIEKEGYEADDILGTLAKWGQANDLEVTILTGDRDSFQLIDKNIKVRIPRTKMGKTETEDYDIEKIKEEYGMEPLDLIQLKGLMGDSSDNIPGVPGVGPKTAGDLIIKYKTIEGVYEHIDELKGKIKENLENNKELAFLSRTLGTIDIEADIELDFNKFEIKPWDNVKVFEIFKRLKFNRFIERFNLSAEQKENKIITNIEPKRIENVEEILKKIREERKLIYYIDTANKDNENIIKKEIKLITIFLNNEVLYSNNIYDFQDVFEDKNILKCGYKQREDFIILKENGIEPRNLMFDVEIAAYVLNSNISKYTLEYLAEEYLKLDINEYINNKNNNKQMSLFEQEENKEKDNLAYIKAYVIAKLHPELIKRLKENDSIELFNNIEMPLVEVLASMQYEGVLVDKEELTNYGNELKSRLDELTNQIYQVSETEFNINSTKQLGEILFEKLNLPALKKTKTGYSTDNAVLEKLKGKHPIIDLILEYRKLAKLNSTYVEGLIPYINKKTARIHSSFQQTVTATGRISSSDPNLQNIPTRFELGKKLRKVFKAKENCIFIDADYSQIELRILAHIANDENMIDAFKQDEDIHKQVAANVFGIELDQVTKEQRSSAKAVNFGIVYGISDFGLAEQLGISRKSAKQYIEQYLNKYLGIKTFMNDIIEQAKEKGYVETLYRRRRYIPEISSNNYMVRQFGNRVAMNTPIQGTAADIMKIAMINIYKKLKEKELKSKLILQVHDEVLIETNEEEIEIVKNILKNEMENVINLSIPLKAELEYGKNWYEAK